MRGRPGRAKKKVPAGTNPPLTPGTDRAAPEGNMTTTTDLYSFETAASDAIVSGDLPATADFTVCPDGLDITVSVHWSDTESATPAAVDDFFLAVERGLGIDDDHVVTSGGFGDGNPDGRVGFWVTYAP